jgi:hypothetical protein
MTDRNYEVQCDGDPNDESTWTWGVWCIPAGRWVPPGATFTSANDAEQHMAKQTKGEAA